MQRGIIAIGLVAALAASVALPARAAPPPSPPAKLATTPAPAARGLAVVAAPGATDAAWPLAQALYADASVRPRGLDEARARILCGEPPAKGAPAELRDLADTVAAVHGEDAPSKALLSEVARRLGVAALVVVHAGAGHPATARVFLADAHDFDAATYAQDPPPSTAWTAAARSLARAFGAPPAPSSPGPLASKSAAAPALATREAPKSAESKTSRPFYISPWFWGALGVAALAGGGAYLLSRDSGPSTIHLQVQGP